MVSILTKAKTVVSDAYGRLIVEHVTAILEYLILERISKPFL